MTDEPRFIKIRYAADESGWAIDLGDGKAELANIPLAAMNIGDVVALADDAATRPVIREVLTRVWDGKTAVHYAAPFKETYQRLHALFRAERGWPMEGAVPGLLMIAHPLNANLVALAGDAGLQITVEALSLCPVAAGCEVESQELGDAAP